MTSSCLEGASPEEAGATESVDEQARLAKKARKRERKVAREALAQCASDGDEDAPGNQMLSYVIHTMNQKSMCAICPCVTCFSPNKTEVDRKPNKRKVANARLQAASMSSIVKADALGYRYPMPWTTEEAIANEVTLQGLCGNKLVLISRVASVSDAQRHRYISESSQRDEVQLNCPFKCGFKSIICFRLHGEC